MPETIILVAIAFLVGYLTRPRLEKWWYWNKLTRCPNCGHWVRWMRTTLAQHRVAGTVRICDKCWHDLYTPEYEDQA